MATATATAVSTACGLRQQFGQNGDVASVEIPGRGDERDWATAQHLLQLVQRGCPLRRLQFCCVPGGELVEPFGLMCVPLAQLGGRRDLRNSPTDARVSLAETTRPQPVDQYSLTIVGSRILVHPRGLDVATGSHAVES
jgi:hypothetical protein